MVRNPALEVINCIKHTDFQQPAIRSLVILIIIPFYTIALGTFESQASMDKKKV